jgi:hypothetical protein
MKTNKQEVQSKTLVASDPAVTSCLPGPSGSLIESLLLEYNCSKNFSLIALTVTGAAPAMVGALITGAGVLLRDTGTGNMRLILPHQYLMSIGLGNTTQEAERRAAIKALPQLFVD